MHLSMFLCRLHGFPMVGFGFTTPVCERVGLLVFRYIAFLVNKYGNGIIPSLGDRAFFET